MHGVAFATVPVIELCKRLRNVFVCTRFTLMDIYDIRRFAVYNPCQLDIEPIDCDRLLLYFNFILLFRWESEYMGIMNIHILL